MRKCLAALALVAVAATTVTMPASAARKSGEEQLAQLIEGRIAGQPTSCVNMRLNENLTIIDKTALVYKQGNRLWVNRTARPETLDEDDILVIRKFGTSNLCRNDTITTLDRSSRMFNGVVFLEDFVPYERAS